MLAIFLPLLCLKMVVCQIQVYIWRHNFLVLPVRPISFSIFRSHHFLEFKALKILWLKRHSSVIFICTITKMVSCGSNDKQRQKIVERSLCCSISEFSICFHRFLACNIFFNVFCLFTICCILLYILSH